MLKRDETSGGSFRLNPLTAAIAAAFSYAAAPQMALAQSDAANEDDEDTIDLGDFEVTGSRLGRADIEGALPVAVISRDDIDRSGFGSVGELLRNTTFSSFGAFRAQSGSSAQSLVAIDLRGLGSERTLVLIDGRRAPKAPFAPSAQDLNAVPIAAVERIEILKDGASAIYGSDAIGGVVNIITRKDFNGTEFTFQEQSTAREGGDSRNGQIVSGIAGERGNIVFGVSYFDRDIIFARDSLFTTPQGSFFSNNYVLGASFVDDDNDFIDDNTGNPYYGRVPGGCPNSDPAFSEASGNNATGVIPNCGYDFTRISADEAATGNQGLFVRSNYQFSDDWSLSLSGSASRATSFGRYAPSLAFPPIFVAADNPFNELDQDFYLYHRFAGLGPRDNDTDSNVYDITGIFSGRIGPVDVEFGTRHNEYQFYELGRNYVVIPLAARAIENEQYDFRDPRNNPDSVLNGMKATITRDSIWVTKESFAEAQMSLFDMQGGTARGLIGAEYREEEYFDQYDSLQEAGVIGGSAGNSAGTDRRVKSAFFEMFLPVIDTLEVTLSGRFEEYDDVGNNFAPKISARFQPLPDVTLRASVGQGFRAPDLSVISALPSFSAEPIGNDEATCLADDPNNTFDQDGQQCLNANGDPTQQQVNSTIISNPELEAEDSDQFSFGGAWDVNEFFNFSLDYYNIAISERINFISPGEIVNRLTTGDPIPAGLGVTRNPNRGNQIVQVVAGSANDGELDTSGFDFEALFTMPFAGLGDFRSSLRTSYVLSYEIDGGRDLVGDPGVPEYRVTMDNTFTSGPFAVAFNGNHIADTAAAVDNVGNQTGHIESWTTWDLQVEYDLPVIAGGTIGVGALNVFDRDPPLSPFDGRNYNFFLYNQYGRQPYVKYTQRFE